MVESPEKLIKNQIYSIYCIKNKKNDLKYIGQTIRPVEDRWKQHKLWAKLGASGSLIHKALKEHGEESFEFSVLNTTLNIEELDILEQEAIKAFGTMHPDGYNMSAGGRSGRKVRGLKKKPSEGFRLSGELSLVDLKDLIESMRKMGVRSLKKGELHIELAPEALFPETEYKKKKKDAEMKESQPDPIAEAEKVMFWSTGVEGPQ